MKPFKAYLDKKEREAKKQLKIVKKLLESQNMKVSDHLDADDPYLFLHTPNSNLTFDGIRIYKIADQMAFRIQKSEKTEPFGNAYSLDLEEIFNDMMTDHHNPMDAGKEVVKAVTEEMQRFFKKSAEAEKELRSTEFDPADPFNKIVMRNPGAGDYSNFVFSKST
jgi:hypothetical protein